MLGELRSTITAELDRLQPEIEQLTLDFSNEERAQIRGDLDALRARVAAIPEEIQTEQALIDARYADQHPLMFPAAVTILVPRSLAADIERGI